jgi:hypothetical protein
MTIEITVDEFGRSPLAQRAGRYGSDLTVGQEVTIEGYHPYDRPRSAVVLDVGTAIHTGSPGYGDPNYVLVTLRLLPVQRTAAEEARQEAARQAQLEASRAYRTQE